MFYFVMFGGYLLEACSFLRRDRKGVDPGGGGRSEQVEEWGSYNKQDIVYEEVIYERGK